MDSSMRRRLLTLALAPVFATPLAAQGRGRHAFDVPPGHLPPPGQCRVWLRGVPPGHQPPPMDCRSALRGAPRDAQVLYGGTYAAGSRGDWAYRDGGERDGRAYRRDDGGRDRWRGGDDRRDDRWRRDDDARDRGRRDYGSRDDDAWIVARRRPGPCLVRDQWGACALRVAIVVHLP